MRDLFVRDEVEIRFTLNGQRVQAEVTALQPLLDLLRDTFGLTGTKLGCGEGECGACTVLVDGRSVNSCLYLAADCHGKSVVTIEGLAQAGELDPLQAAFVREGAVQCGFCTPGMVLQAKSILDRHPGGLDEAQVRRAIEGNLCRCTGYDKIVKAVLSVAAERSGEGEP